MEENKHIEELDAFAKKYITDIEPDTPSIDFTSNLMEAIHETENASVFKPTPLISSKVWIVLFVILITSIIYVSNGESIAKLWQFKFNYSLNNIVPDFLNTLSISNIMLYACFFFTVLIFVQIYLLKARFENYINS
ncbi:hypothetical protein [Tenacibaculum agarivorans]|uniref:hypothetical protein n=1 Tax=Tenacibaculum agarivorans TaxID=1908389 RepID=UPI00094BBDB5|nr:hypothetical protein [Tenacibaculum agarivorans]